ncbi:MAG: glycosyltransferase family 2 protein [Vicinamibacterales bacterium]
MADARHGDPRLAIVIVSYNARADLERCLRSLRDAPPSTRHEIVVFDNASSDGSAEAAAKWPGVRVLRSDRNLGFAAGTNAGIRATTAPLLLFLNSDTSVPAHSIDELVRNLEAHASEGVVAAGPRLIDADGYPELSFGSMVGPLAELRQKVVGGCYTRRYRWAVAYVRRRTSAAHYPEWVSGACMLVRREAAEAAGLFDERYFLYLEDVDFCAALRRQGGRILFASGVEVLHFRGRSGVQQRAAVNAAYRRSQLAFYEKHHPRWAPLLRLYLRARGQLPDVKGHRPFEMSR